MKKYILFDLDGTIINSELGVTSCVQYALKHFGIEETDLAKLRVFIGPPLRVQFHSIYGFGPEDAETAVAKYRERYGKKGMYECELYPYVEEILKHLKERGFVLALASSKNESACLDILKHFKIDGYFDLIGGATDDGKISEKADVLRMIMERLGLTDTKEMVLIGDTRFDARGAGEVDLDCIGVTYGFGTREELKEAGVITICSSLEEVEAYLEEQQPD